MKVLLTGGAGFIGSHVSRYLLDHGYEVHIADRFSYAGKIRNIANFLRDAKLWVGDLKSEEFCQKLAAFPFDSVIHLAGNTHVDRSITDPLSFSLDNIGGTNQLLHAFEPEPRTWKRRRDGCPELHRFILYTTDEVFGSTPAGQIFDEQTPFNPSNAYSASKVGIEGLAKAYVTTHGMPIVVCRPCNTYGRGQHPEKAIPRFTRQALTGQPMTVHNDGAGSRDWLHTEDHASAIHILLEKSEPGQSYNLAAGDEHTDIEVANRIGDIVFGKTGYKAYVSFVPGRPGHDRRYLMDGTKLRGLGWKPRIPFTDGLKDAVEWTAENLDWWDHDYVKMEALVGAS